MMKRESFQMQYSGQQAVYLQVGLNCHRKMALFIQERGRAARGGVFCPPSVTPRNLLISSGS